MAEWPKWQRLAMVAANVSVGSWWTCHELAAEFDRVLHIVSPGAECQCPAVRSGDLTVTMLEGQPLGRELIELIGLWGLGTDHVLVHCTAGECRGPLAAVIVLVARGLGVGEAVGAVSDAMMGQYHHETPPTVFSQVLAEVYQWRSGWARR